MPTESPRQKEQRTVPLPADLTRFLVTVSQQIEAGDEATTTPSDDLLQCRCAYGGLVEDATDLFGFTYFNRETDGKWELLLSRQELLGIAAGDVTHLNLWHCVREGCANAFSNETALCDDCDWTPDPDDAPPAAGKPGSPLADMIATLQAEDPDFGKVNNQSGDEFAFEVVGSPSVEAVASMTEAEASAKVSALDDFGTPVLSVPLESTCREVFTDVARYLTPLGDEDSLTPGAVIHRVAVQIMAMVANPDQFELYEDELKEIKALRFYRFFHSDGESWWTCTFDPDGD